MASPADGSTRGIQCGEIGPFDREESGGDVNRTLETKSPVRMGQGLIRRPLPAIQGRPDRRGRTTRACRIPNRARSRCRRRIRRKPSVGHGRRESNGCAAMVPPAGASGREFHRAHVVVGGSEEDESVGRTGGREPDRPRHGCERCGDLLPKAIAPRLAGPGRGRRRRGERPGSGQGGGGEQPAAPVRPLLPRAAGPVGPRHGGAHRRTTRIRSAGQRMAATMTEGAPSSSAPGPVPTCILILPLPPDKRSVRPARLGLHHRIFPLMSVRVVGGTTALDSINTPKAKNPGCWGDRALHAAVAASFFSPVKLVGVVGTIFRLGTSNCISPGYRPDRGLESA